MEFWALFIMFICLCVDNMVMANMSGMKSQNDGVRSTLSLRIALSFSIFHVLFFILGYALGYIFSPFPYTWLASVWISFSFVLLIGIRLLLETVEKSPSFSVANSDNNKKILKVAAWLALNTLMLGFCVEIMATKYNLFWPVFALFAVSMVMSLVGFLIGKPGSKQISSKIFESVAGIVMIILAVRILIMHYS